MLANARSVKGSEKECTVVHSLEVVNESQDVPVPNGHSLQDSNLIPDHMFSTGHQALVNHLSSIVATSIDVNTFLDD